MEALEAFILAGGKSSRFGSDKTLHMFNGRPLIEHVLHSLKPLFQKISIVANDTDKYSYLTIPVYPDIIPGIGPLGGIYTALKRSSTDYIFVCAADMPFVNQEFVTFMLQIPHIYDCIIPYWSGNLEPLHAIYSRSCLPYIKNLIDQKRYKIQNLLDYINVRYITDEELIFYAEDPSELFYNINSPNDLPHTQ